MHLRAPSYLKVAYILVVLSAVLPIGLASSSWVSLATGGSGGVPILGPIVLLLLGLYRIFLVARVPGTLDAPDVAGLGIALRKIGIFLLIVGSLFAALNLVSRPLLMAVPSSYRSGAPIFFVAGMYLAVLSGLGMLGLTLFEFSRLLGFEQSAREQNS
jgi:hypothetical protein